MGQSTVPHFLCTMVYSVYFAVFVIVIVLYYITVIL